MGMLGLLNAIFVTAANSIIDLMLLLVKAFQVILLVVFTVPFPLILLLAEVFVIFLFMLLLLFLLLLLFFSNAVIIDAAFYSQYSKYF